MAAPTGKWKLQGSENSQKRKGGVRENETRRERERESDGRNEEEEEAGSRFNDMLLFYRQIFYQQQFNETICFIFSILPKFTFTDEKSVDKMENERTLAVIPNFQMPKDNLLVILILKKNYEEK